VADESLPPYVIVAERRKPSGSGCSVHRAACAAPLLDKFSSAARLNTESPANWDQDRKAKYLDWAVSVIAGCRGVNDQLEQRFDEAIEDARGRLL
jgi:hypothetical protein